MNNKDIKFIYTIEKLLYDTSSFSNKINSLLSHIARYYDADFVALVNKSKKFLYTCGKNKKEEYLNLLNKIDTKGKLKGENPILFFNIDEVKAYLLNISVKQSSSMPSVSLFICLTNLADVDLEILELLQEIIKNFYKSFMRIKSLKREYYKVKLLYDISKTIENLDKIDMETSLYKIMTSIKKYISYNYFSLYILDANGILKRVNLDSPYEIDLLQNFRFHLGIGFSAWVAKAEKPILINNLRSQERFKIKEVNIVNNVNSIVFIPLIFRKKLIGVLNIARKPPYKFYKKELKILNIIGNQVASVLENIGLLSRLENMAYTDALTGLFNYRYFTMEFEKELKRGERYNYSVSFIILDIDDFKKVNDDFGHEIGNEVLKKLSNILLKELRTVDIVARYGGEEFVILLPNTTKEGAKVLAERLRSQVEKKFSTIGTKNFPHITITLGISSFPEDGNNLYELIEKADRALYYGKRHGKNRVFIYDEGVNENCQYR